MGMGVCCVVNHVPCSSEFENNEVYMCVGQKLNAKTITFSGVYQIVVHSLSSIDWLAS